MQTIVQNVPYTDTGLPLQQAIDACNASAFGYGPNCNENLPWNVNAPGNSPGGDLDGYELSYQQPFSFLDGIGSNFGLLANYTHVEAKIDYLGVVGGVTTVVRPDESLVNLSDNTMNLTFYFENDKLGARISLAERDDYLTSVPGRNGTYVERTEGTNNIDFSANYNFNDQPQAHVRGAESDRRVREPAAGRDGAARERGLVFPRDRQAVLPGASLHAVISEARARAAAQSVRRSARARPPEPRAPEFSTIPGQRSAPVARARCRRRRPRSATRDRPRTFSAVTPPVGQNPTSGNTVANARSARGPPAASAGKNFRSAKPGLLREQELRTPWQRPAATATRRRPPLRAAPAVNPGLTTNCAPASRAARKLRACADGAGADDRIGTRFRDRFDGRERGVACAT